jgi:hypothetical protein
MKNQVLRREFLHLAEAVSRHQVAMRMPEVIDWQTQVIFVECGDHHQSRLRNAMQRL